MAEDSVILTWNVTNWVTVIIMAAAGFIVLGFIQKLVAKQRANAAATAASAAGA